MNTKSIKLISGFYLKYVIYFSSIVLAVIIVMGAYLYRYYYSTIYKDFISANSQYLTAVINNHEKGMELIKNMSVQLGMSDTVTPFRLTEDPVKSIQFRNQLKTYQVMSQFYQKFFMMFYEDEYVYNDTTTVNMEQFLSTGFLLEGESQHMLYSLLKQPGRIGVFKEQIISGSLMYNEKAVMYLLPIQPGNKGTLLFIVSGSFYDTLLQCPQEEKRASYILKDGRVIVSRGGEFFEEPSLEKILAAKESSINNFEVEGNNSRYLVTVREGSYGFQYVTLQSTDIFKKKVFSAQWGLLLLVLIILIPSIVLIVILSRSMQKPVDVIGSLLFRDGTAKDFEVIQKGIKDLVGNNQELAEIVQESQSVRRIELIRSLVRGDYKNHEDFIKQGKKVGLSLERKFYAIVLTGSSQQIDENPILESLLKLFNSDESVTGFGCELMTHNQTLFTFFSDTEEEVLNFASSFFTFGKNLSESFVMAISDIHEDFSQVSSAYLEANTAFDNRFIMGESNILSFKDLVNSNNESTFPRMYIDALKNALRQGDEEGMNSVIDEIFRHLRSSGQSLFTFRVLYNDIISVLINEWSPCNLEIHKLYDIFTLSHCLSIKDLDNMLRSLCTTLLSNKGKKNYDLKNKMEEAAAYMRDNYSNSNLNMNALADHLSISAVALSVNFKDIMGMSPSDYLTLLRIERAKELLCETDLAVKEICGAVGYSDQRGFMRRFKQYTAKSPTQFRQEYGKESS
jgi:AraC-like DNA-binding protein